MGNTGFPSNVNSSACAKFTSTSAVCYGLWCLRSRRVSCARSLGTAQSQQMWIQAASAVLAQVGDEKDTSLPLCRNAEVSLPFSDIKYLMCLVPGWWLFWEADCPHLHTTSAFRELPKTSQSTNQLLFLSPKTRKSLSGHTQSTIHGSMIEALLRHFASPITHI